MKVKNKNMKKEELQLVENMLHKVTKEIISEEIAQEDNTKKEMQDRIVDTLVKEQMRMGQKGGGKTGKTPGIALTSKVHKEDGKEIYGRKTSCSNARRYPAYYGEGCST